MIVRKSIVNIYLNVINMIDYIVRHLRRYRYATLSKRLKNKDFTLLSNNCLGAIYLHDIHQPFNTPMVNAGMVPKEYLKFLNNLEYYLSLEIKMAPEESNSKQQYGYVGDVHVWFEHFKYADEPREKWNIRRKRVNMKNLFVMMTEKDNCTYEDLVAFDNLPFENKVVFTARDYPEIKSAFHLKGCIDPKTGQLGYAYDFPNRYSLKRYMEQFDLIKWFNNNQ